MIECVRAANIAALLSIQQSGVTPPDKPESFSWTAVLLLII